MRLSCSCFLAAAWLACIGDHVSPGGRGDVGGGEVCEEAEGEADCEATVACVRGCVDGDEECVESCYRDAASQAVCEEAEDVVSCLEDLGKGPCACE